MIQAIDLTFSYGDKPLYKKANFVVGKGQKVGLVGPNGSGKSTLISIITGQTNDYTGKILVSGKTALVPQEVKHDPIMDRSESVNEYVDSESVYPEHEIKKMFFGLELGAGLNDNPKLLSGGQKTKLALARALLQNPDILLLDEPTNFMDKGGKAWVMKFLSDYKGTVIVISHDLELMDNNIDKILAITPYNSKITEYKGTYSDYLRLKKQKEENLKKEYAIKSRHLQRMEEGYMKMRADEKKSVRRRKIERERQNLPEIPPEIKKIKVKVPEPKRAGEVLLKAVAIDKNYDENKVLSNATLSILRNERIAFIGVNGSGKSTLIKIIAGITEPDSGEVIKDPRLSIGYYSQEFETLDFDKSVITAFCVGTERDEGFARSYLGRFMLSGNKIFQRVESLSGGEKTRLSIAILTGKDNNLLILDEPTTYLDVLSQRVILEALKDYKGAMVVVSHTEEFIKELNPNRAVLFPEQKVVLWDRELLDRIGEV